MKPANQALHDLEQIARRIRERVGVVKGEAFPERHEPFGWELEPEPYPVWKE